MAFLLLADLHESSATEYKALLDESSEWNIKHDAILERLAEFGASYDEAWKFLISSMIAGTNAVVVIDPTTGRMSRLALIKSQRDEILQKLQSTFGEGFEI